MNFQFLEMKKQLLGFIVTLFIANLATQMKAMNNCFRSLKQKLEVFESGKKNFKKKFQKKFFLWILNLDF